MALPVDYVGDSDQLTGSGRDLLPALRPLVGWAGLWQDKEGPAEAMQRGVWPSHAAPGGVAATKRIADLAVGVWPFEVVVLV